MSEVYEIADTYVLAYAALDPIAATEAGIAGHEHELTDYSPDAGDARDRLDRDTIAALRDAKQVDHRDRIAADVMVERLELSIALHDASEELRALRIIGSPVQEIRGCFDLMAYDTEHDWEIVAQRLAIVPDSIASLEAGLREGLERNIPAARRQVIGCAKQAATWGGAVAGTTPFFVTLVAGHDGDAKLHAELERNAALATDAYAQLARFLDEEYAPKADPHDPAGRERYALYSRAFNGIELDLDETYAWGWEELYRIEERMRTVAARILPGETVVAVADHLDHDLSRTIEGEREFQQWNQDLIDRTISELDGTHFDIAEPLRKCEAMLAPPGGAAAMYYTGPSEDFSRPGRTWYPTQGRTTFPLWREVSTCYHEGVPGHHLQVAQVKYLSEQLSRYQRAFGFLSGHGEGWALYAEQLMGELGYLDDPAYELGMLCAQAMRAVRVIVDIGMHLELSIPDSESEHAGETWTPELALPFVIERSCEPPDFMRSEVDRYLGWPGQAISYKVGERVWLEARADAQARHGASFDLKQFHSYALDLGGMGLGPLRDELGRF
jgi:uncharacterized protein (DUF885 family)